MNLTFLTFPIVLAIAGILLVLIGVIGEIKIKDWNVGTKSTPGRTIIALFGVGLLVGAFLVYQSDKLPGPNNGNTNSNPSPSPTPSPEVGINTISADEPLVVKTDDGAARIPVSGTVKGFPESANSSVYVFTSTGDFSEWWFNMPVRPNQDGSWSTSGLAGSREEPAEANQTVKIRAVYATSDEIKNAKKDPSLKMVADLSSFKNISRELTITIMPKNN